MIGFDRPGCRQVVDVDQVLVEPLPIGILRRKLALDLLVVDDAALGGVDKEGTARLQTSLDENVLGWDIEELRPRRP